MVLYIVDNLFDVSNGVADIAAVVIPAHNMPTASTLCQADKLVCLETKTNGVLCKALVLRQCWNIKQVGLRGVLCAHAPIAHQKGCEFLIGGVDAVMPGEARRICERAQSRKSGG